MQTGKAGSAHEQFSRHAEIKLASDRTFGLVFGVFFLLIGAVPLLRGGQSRTWALIASGAFLAAALLWPRILHPLNLLVAKASAIVQRIISPVVAGVFFFGALTPIAILFRRHVRESMGLRFQPQAESYWRQRQPPGPAPKSMVNQF